MAAVPVISPEAFLAHWQGHRALTRRVIEAFPEDQFNTFSIGGLRPFGAQVQELLSLAVPTMVGIVRGEWTFNYDRTVEPKGRVLARWDADTVTLNELFAQVRPEAWGETMNAFGFYEGPPANIIFYAIDNEIHHRAQGYVYLRALGIAPPPFHER